MFFFFLKKHQDFLFLFLSNWEGEGEERNLSTNKGYRNNNASHTPPSIHPRGTAVLALFLTNVVSVLFVESSPIPFC